MNRKRRERNRFTARELSHLVHENKMMQHICENCGKSGGHWHAIPQSLQEIIAGFEPTGFYSCMSNAVANHDGFQTNGNMEHG